MFIDRDDKTLVLHPAATKAIHGWLTEIEVTLGKGGYATPDETRNAQTRVRALAQVLNSGFGKAARVTPDTPEGSLFVAEYADVDAESASYVFGCVRHSNGEVGVHS